MTQSQRIEARRDAEQGPDQPRPSAASRRRFRDRVILTQPPPPRPTPRRPAGDDQEPPATQPTGEADSEERSEQLLAEIDDLIDGR